MSYLNGYEHENEFIQEVTANRKTPIIHAIGPCPDEIYVPKFIQNEDQVSDREDLMAKLDQKANDLLDRLGEEAAPAAPVLMMEYLFETYHISEEDCKFICTLMRNLLHRTVENAARISSRYIIDKICDTPNLSIGIKEKILNMLSSEYDSD